MDPTTLSMAILTGIATMGFMGYFASGLFNK